MSCAPILSVNLCRVGASLSFGLVDYINDDAPLAHIPGYLVRRSDYILFPEGELRWLHLSGQSFRTITEAMTRRQMNKNLTKDKQ